MPVAAMTKMDCIAFLQWALPKLGFKWAGCCVPIRDFIERRSGGRRTQQRRTHAENRRGAGCSYQVPRRLRGDRRQREGRRATG